MNLSPVPHPTDILHGGGTSLACAPDGSMSADGMHGFFVEDTRLLSTYRVTLGGAELEVLSRRREGHGTAVWQYQNGQFDAGSGAILPGSVFVSLRRRVNGGLHDDLRVTSYVMGMQRMTLIVQLDADFADLFEVRLQLLPPRLGVHRTGEGADFRINYSAGRFHRALSVLVEPTGPAPAIAGPRMAFDIELAHGQTWSCCMSMTPEVDGRRVEFIGDPHTDEEDAPTPVTIECDDLLAAPFRRGLADLESLIVGDDGAQYVAAGVPWYQTLFGRDTLTSSLMTGMIGCTAARGTLRAVGSLQSTIDDPWRDAEPGKLPHEIRFGELATKKLIPHTPYYGTHDAQALYCLALWNTWRWTGDRRLLVDHLPTARAALRWCDEHGDVDADGLQEYRTRSPVGYYNQSWKDAIDAIVGADGSQGSLPLATVELQGYLYAARLAMAELLDEEGHTADADDLRGAADALADLVEDRYFLEGEQFYALALDGAKRPLTSISSNPGHLLWCGLPSAQRAAAVADRLVRDDMYSGWGLRTLSADNPAYNALSYQLGSVWPHDTVLAAAGLIRYGFHDQAGMLLRAVLEAACMFEGDRLPELFCGFHRSDGPPVPYPAANVPQAWAAAAPVLAAQTFLGLVPDAPRRRCSLSPWLPEWLPRLAISGIVIGDGMLDVVLELDGDSTRLADVHANDVDVVVEPVVAPLWGTPPRLSERRRRTGTRT